MPREVFVARAGKSLHPGRVLKLARDFETSIMATALRCQQLLGVSVFQVEAGGVAWGYGTIRRQQDLQADAHGFQEAITRAMRGDNGEGMVFVKQRDFRLQWVRLQGEDRALFLLQSEHSRFDLSPRVVPHSFSVAKH